jgi:hypothetical protein
MTGLVRGCDKMQQIETQLQRWQLGMLCLQRVWQFTGNEARQSNCEQDRFRDSISCGNCKQQFYLEDVSKFLEHKFTQCRGKSSKVKADVKEEGMKIPEGFSFFGQQIETETEYAEDLSIKSKQEKNLPLDASKERPSDGSYREGSSSSLSFTSNPSEDDRDFRDDISETQDLSCKRSPVEYKASTQYSYLT